MTEKYNYFITHIIISEPPPEGFDQLFYYGVKDKTLKDGKFYWGRGNNSFNKKFIDNLLAENKIQKINTKIYPFPIKDNETLWFDKTGAVYKADIKDPLINQEKICFLKSLNNNPESKL